MSHIKPHKSYDCTVIGGGIVGLLCARELSLSGLKIALIEKGKVGKESSWAGGGILSSLYPWREPQALQSLATYSQVIYPELVGGLIQATGIDPELITSGLLSFGLSGQEIHQASAWASDNGQKLETIDHHEIIPAPGNINPAVFPALFNPSVAQVRNPVLLEALKKDLQIRGVDIFENNALQNLDIRNAKIHRVVTETGIIKTGLVVATLGAWSDQYIPDLKIRPVRGQMLCFHSKIQVTRSILLQNGLYIIPRLDGHLLVGSTIEEVGFNKGTTEAAATDLSCRASHILPAIRKLTMTRHWSGLRPASDSGLPVICAHPDINGLYINTGHFRNGILLAPGSARLLADLILKRSSCLNPVSYGWPRESSPVIDEAVH